MTERGNVLIAVEDDPDFRVLIRVALSADPRVEVAGDMPADVDQAVELVRQVSPRLIILDHNLEGKLVGLEAAPRLKEAAPDAKILLFTAYDVAAEARREPAVDAFLRKDQVDRLLSTTRELLGLDPG